jgi:hypothetical protein
MNRPNSDQLLADLEESMPQGRANSTQFADTDEDDFDSLDALLADSLTTAAQERQYQLDRKARKANFTGMSREEVEFCNSRMAAFEMAREWIADKALAVFARYNCTNCLDTKTVFTRYMEHHKHRRNPTASRWLAVQSTKFHPEAVYEDRSVAMCTTCAPKANVETHSMRTLQEAMK